MAISIDSTGGTINISVTSNPAGYSVSNLSWGGGSVTISGNKITIPQNPNTGSSRTGALEFTITTNSTAGYYGTASKKLSDFVSDRTITQYCSECWQCSCDGDCSSDCSSQCSCDGDCSSQCSCDGDCSSYCSSDSCNCGGECFYEGCPSFCKPDGVCPNVCVSYGFCESVCLCNGAETCVVCDFDGCSVHE